MLRQQLGSIVVQALLIHGFRVGIVGVHAWEVSLDQYSDSSLVSKNPTLCSILLATNAKWQLILIATLIYIPVTVASKVTLCVFFYRLSPVRLYKFAVYVTAFVCVAGLAGIWFSILFACQPVAAAWDVRLLLSAKCIDRGSVYITQAALGSITDVMLLVLPIPTVIGLQMRWRQKLGLLGMFGIGSVTLVTSIVRLVVLLPSLSSLDQTWALADSCLWMYVGISPLATLT
jgi:hypothetical protein